MALKKQAEINAEIIFHIEMYGYFELFNGFILKKEPCDLPLCSFAEEAIKALNKPVKPE